MAAVIIKPTEDSACTACKLSLWFNGTKYTVLFFTGDGLAGERSDEGLHAQSAGWLKGAGSDPFRDKHRPPLSWRQGGHDGWAKHNRYLI